MVKAEQEAREAFALIQQGRRTLREARARQHQVRLNRQYYKNNFQKPFTPSGKGGPSSRGPPVMGPTRCRTLLPSLWKRPQDK